jgi:hypothetical protein
MVFICTYGNKVALFENGKSNWLGRAIKEKKLNSIIGKFESFFLGLF